MTYKQDKKTTVLVKSALMAALVTVSTMVVQIPSPTQGYINLGDCFVLLSGWMLGPVYGALAGGLGSALTDLLLGYSYYAPGTFIIKGLAALTASLVFKALSQSRDKSALSDNSEKSGHSTVFLVISGILGEIFVVAGYFGYSALILGKGAAAALSIPGNLLQAAVGIIVGTVLYKIFKKARLI